MPTLAVTCGIPASIAVRLALAALILLLAALPAAAGSKGAGFQTGFIHYGAGLTPAAFATEIDPYAAGGYYGGNFYNGGSYRVAEALGPVETTAFTFTEAIASWNATTPAGTWIEVLLAARLGDRWTKWYNLGIWAADGATIRRHSVRLQGDADGYVATDTLVLTNKKTAADALRLRVRFFTLDETVAVSAVQRLSIAYSTAAPKKVTTVSTGNPANWDTLIAVPECSQMVYPDGGNVWCSPTSTAMVLKYWADDTGPCEPDVRAAVAGVFDWIYNGLGNWPFNTAYAAAQGLEAYVARFTSLEGVEAWVALDVPVIVSYAWGKGELTGAAIPTSAGHLSVIVGFDAAGNPIVNDPAAATDAAVQRTYARAEFEPLWLKNSGGTVYLIYPAGHATPGF